MREGKVQTGCSVLLAVQHIINGISPSYIHTFIQGELEENVDSACTQAGK